MFDLLKSIWSRWRQKFWLSLGVDVLIIVTLMWGIHLWQTRDLLHQQLAPDTQLTRLFSSDSANIIGGHQVGVVYFFAPWCGYCRHSIGNLDGLLAGNSVAWATAVALDYGDENEVKQFVNQTGISLPVLMGKNSTAADWGVRAFPTYFVVDSTGEIVSRSVGYSTTLGLKARIFMARD
jgi:thiol-disulfide isomerase/thioredoxin